MTDKLAKQKPPIEEHLISVSLLHKLDKELTETSKNSSVHKLSKQRVEPKTIPCDICHRYFKYDISLLLHKKAKHTLRTLLSLSLQCIMSMTNTIKKRNMQKSNQIASSPTEQGLIVITCFTCKLCDSRFKTELSLSMHYKSKHIPCTLLSQSLQCIIPRLKKNVSSDYIVDENGNIWITVNGHKIFFKLTYTKNKYTIKRIKYVTITRIKCDDLENHTTKENTNSEQTPQPLPVKQEQQVFVKKEPRKESKNTQHVNVNTSNNIKKKNSNDMNFNKCLVKRNKVLLETPSDKLRYCNKRNYEYFSSNQSSYSLMNRYNPYNDDNRRKMQELTFKINKAYEEARYAEGKNYNLKCYFCNEWFSDGVSLYIHQDLQHDGQRCCRLCWQVLSSKYLLFQHLNRAHNVRPRTHKPLNTECHLQEPAHTAKKIKKELIKVEVPSAADADFNVKIEPTSPKKIKTEPLIANVKVEPT